MSTFIIELPRDNAPHANSNTEWWYAFAFLESSQKRQYAVMASFFRVGEVESLKGHYLIFSFIDLSRESIKAYSIIDNSLMLSMLSFYLPFYLSQHPLDLKTQELYANLITFNLPSPHKLMGMVSEKEFPVILQYGDKSFRITDSNTGAFALHLSAAGKEVELNFEPQKPLALIGNNGKPDTLFYYSLTRNSVHGHIKHNGAIEEVSGVGWFDHQWGKEHRLLIESGWNWFGILLDDGRELLINEFTHISKDQTFSQMANLIDNSGEIFFTRNVIIRPLKVWKSETTNAAYPIEWEIVIPDLYMYIQVKAIFDNQEMQILGPLQAIWEGACKISGEQRIPGQKNKSLNGLGFMELVGYANYNALNK